MLNELFLMSKIYISFHSDWVPDILLLLYCHSHLSLIDLIILQAHEQLRAVLLTLLEELPSDLSILLLGTSSVALAEVEEVPTSVFPHRSVYD